MPSGFYDIYKLFTRIVVDIKERKYCVVWMHHKDPDSLTAWHSRQVDELTFLNNIMNLHHKESTKMTIEFRTLDPWMSDTKNNYEASA